MVVVVVSMAYLHVDEAVMGVVVVAHGDTPTCPHLRCVPARGVFPRPCLSIYLSLPAAATTPAPPTHTPATPDPHQLTAGHQPALRR